MQGKGVGDFRGMVRFCEGWVWNERLLTEVSEKRKGYGKCDNPSGSRPNFFGRQHLTFDKGGKCGGAKQGIVQKISLMVGMGSDHHHSWLGLTVQQNLTLLNVRE